MGTWVLPKCNERDLPMIANFTQFPKGNDDWWVVSLGQVMI